jgi:HD-like signal output (HDOD) protein/CheY-like chemotaxis protein
MSRRILFVDDEPAILSGLRRSLRSMRNEWEMTFAQSGEEAAEHLEASDFDVVVTDMRMPGMDGVELLARVKRDQPQIVRIVLSGHTDRASIMKATGVAHQYLAKPTDPDELVGAIKRAGRLEHVLADRRVIEAAGGLGALPPMPALYGEVAAELGSEDPSLNRVARIVARDPGMAAKVVQIVNSSFFGMRTRITNPEQAVTMLGIDTVVGLIVSDPFQGPATPGGEDSRWLAGLATGTFAREIAKSEGLDKQALDDAYLAGLLHDCGRSIMALRFPSDLDAVVAEPQTGSVLESERAIFGASHPEIAAFILGVWGLPSTVLEAVAFHHHPGDSGETSFGPSTAVHVASAIVSSECGDHATVIDEAHLEAIDKLDRLGDWKAAYEPPEELTA